MMAKTHLVFSFALGALPLSIQGISTFDPLILQSYFAGLALGSLFPDIDEPQSTIGKRTPLLPHLIRLFTPHRGLTHSFLALMLWTILAFYLIPFSSSIGGIDIGMFALGFAIGNIFHVLGDAMTTGGIPDFIWPLRTRRFVVLPDSLRFSVGSLKEYGWFILFTFLLILQGIGWLQEVMEFRHLLLLFLSDLIL